MVLDVRTYYLMCFPDKGYANTTSRHLVDFGLALQLRMLGLDPKNAT